MESTPAREPEPRPGARGDDSRREPRQLALVALTSDASLLETLESVLANDRRLHVVDRETDLAAALMDPRIGVALLDAAKLQSPLAEVTRRLRSQFPDLILVVAGGPEEQAAIANQVASGGVYRFLHKPVSEQRVKLFVEAALRRHGAGQQSAVASVPERLAAASPRAASRLALVLVGAALVLTAVVAVWQIHRQSPHGGAPATRASAPAGSLPPQAAQDPRLAQAREAFARGELVAPVGRSAADLYVAVLRSAPEDPDAREGLDQVIDQLCSLAEGEITAGRLDEATRYLESARRLDQQHVRVAYLATEIAKERERAALAAARQRARARDLAAAASEGEDSGAGLPAPPASPAALPDTVAAAAPPSPVLAASPAAPPAAPAAATPSAATLPAATSLSTGVPAPAMVPPLAVAPPSPAAAPPLAVATSAAAAPAPVPSPAASNIVPASTLHRVKYREPRYPQAARAKNLGGWVDLEFTVRSDGSVGGVQALGADPPGVFETAAIEAVSDWRYLPVLRDGAPVAQRASVRIRFALEP